LRIDFKNSNIFEGNFSKGKKHGLGIYSELKSAISKEQMSDLKINAGGSKLLYKGEFEKDQFHGMGYLKAKKKKIFGSFRRGKANGVCICLDRATRSIKFGRFREGRISGYGIEITPNFTFKGKFSEGKASDLGILTLRNRKAT
jgi:hypothetical protein